MSDFKRDLKNLVDWVYLNGADDYADNKLALDDIVQALPDSTQELIKDFIRKYSDDEAFNSYLNDRSAAFSDLDHESALTGINDLDLQHEDDLFSFDELLDDHQAELFDSADPDIYKTELSDQPYYD